MAGDTTRRSAAEALVKGTPAERALVVMSDSRKIGLKGPGACAWLSDHHVSCPADVYGIARVEDSLAVRIASNEVILESPGPSTLVQRIHSELETRVDGVYRVEQQTETLVFQGSHAPRVWAETCGVNVVREPVDRILYTRVAGISCGIIPEGEGDQRAYRIWVDYSYAPDLYRTLLDIVSKL